MVSPGVTTPTAPSPSTAQQPACWPLYFPDTPWSPEEGRESLLVRDVVAALMSPVGWSLLSSGQLAWHGRWYSLQMEYAALEGLVASQEDLSLALINCPGVALQCLAVAAHEVSEGLSVGPLLRCVLHSSLKASHIILAIHSHITSSWPVIPHIPHSICCCHSNQTADTVMSFCHEIFLPLSVHLLLPLRILARCSSPARHGRLPPC